MTKDNKPPRMTRAQISEALDTIPLDSILAGSRTESRITPKQREFARNLALGKSKAQSYREAYNSKGNKKTHAANGHKVSLSAEVQQIKKAYELAIEAAKQRTPAQLRELVIHRLTKEALDDDVPPATRVAALKLLGTVSEVAAFTERKEVHTIKRSEDVRAALVEKLRMISGSVSDGVIVTDQDTADSLLAEINAGHAANAEENSQPATPDADPPALDPTPCPPPSMTFTTLSQDLHNVPHSQSLVFSNDNEESDSLDISDAEVIGVDEHVSLCIDEVEPIVAEKVPAETPTPSDMEDPPACSEAEKG